MECSFAIYCDSGRASDIKIHKVVCPEHEKLERHDHERFYSPTYANAKIIAELLSEDRNLGHSNCQHCKPSP